MSNLSIHRSIVGDKNNVIIPRAYILFTNGDYAAAQVLCQALYWTESTTSGIGDGWFEMPEARWKEDYYLSMKVVNRCVVTINRLAKDVIDDMKRHDPGFRIDDIKDGEASDVSGSDLIQKSVKKIVTSDGTRLDKVSSFFRVEPALMEVVLKAIVDTYSGNTPSPSRSDPESDQRADSAIDQRADSAIDQRADSLLTHDAPHDAPHDTSSVSDSDESSPVAPSKSESPSIRVIDNSTPGVVMAEVDGETVIGVDPALTPEKPKRKSNMAWEIYQAMLEANGLDRDTANKGVMLRAGKELGELGFVPEEVSGCIRWIQSWGPKYAFADLNMVKRHIDRWRVETGGLRSAETNVSPLAAEDTEWAKNHQFVPAFGHGWVERELERRKREQQEMDGLL